MGEELQRQTVEAVVGEGILALWPEAQERLLRLVEAAQAEKLVQVQVAAEGGTQDREQVVEVLRLMERTWGELWEEAVETAPGSWPEEAEVEVREVLGCDWEVPEDQTPCDRPRKAEALQTGAGYHLPAFLAAVVAVEGQRWPLKLLSVVSEAQGQALLRICRHLQVEGARETSGLVATAHEVGGRLPPPTSHFDFSVTEAAAEGRVGRPRRFPFLEG